MEELVKNLEQATIAHVNAEKTLDDVADRYYDDNASGTEYRDAKDAYRQSYQDLLEARRALRKVELNA